MNNKLDYTNIKGMIFDLDGTLFDSMKIWGEIDTRFFLSHNMSVPENYEASIAHMNINDIAIFTKEKYQLKETVEEILQYWTDMALKMYTDEVQLKPGSIEYIEELKSRHYTLSIATSNQPSLYLPCLKRHKILDKFDFILDTNTINSSKKDPKIYLSLAEKMKIKPNECIVYEDLLTALQSAKTVGFKIVGVEDIKSSCDKEKIKNLSDVYIKDFTELL